MLALEVEFLLGRYAATDFRDRDRPEWPPHPARLYSALVAAAFESELGESGRAALLWLESLPPPQICADEAPSVQSPLTAFVPINDPAEDFMPRRAERQPRSFPSVVPQNSSVTFIWPDAQPDTILRELLGVIAAKVTYLGSSRSPVRVRLVDQCPVPNWTPDEDGADILRVPRSGRLDILQRHFENGLRPPVGAFQRYHRGTVTASSPAPESVYGEMVVYRLGGPLTMEVETTLKLTDTFRAAVMRQAQDTGGGVPELLSGHEADGRPSSRPHAAYVALPFVSDSQENADGHVMGLAVVLPGGISTAERRSLRRTLANLRQLFVPGLGRLDLERVTPEQSVPLNLRPSTWAGPARRWASVTPVLMDRFPRRNRGGVSEVVARSCTFVGLPRPAEVLADRHSPLHGVEPSFRYVTRRATTNHARLYTHVRLTFEREVRGPILLGAGRYFGLGLLRPLREDRQ